MLGAVTGGRTVTCHMAGHPLFGHLWAFRADRLDLLEACIRTPGDVIELRIRTLAYVLKRARDVRYVLVDAEHRYVKDQRNVGARATRIFGHGLMTSAGPTHRDMRRRVQPAFRRESVAALAEQAAHDVDPFIDRWTRAGEFDLAGEMTRFALRTLIGSIFGVQSGSDLEAIENGVVARRDSMTRGRASIVPLPAFLPMALRPSRRRAISDLDEVLDRVIRTPPKRVAPSTDLLSMIVDAHDARAPEWHSRQVHEHALTLVLAAYENIARALTWTFLAVAQHPDVAAKLRAEVRGVLGDRAPKVADAPYLRHTEMALAESLRLWPPNALLSRVAVRDDLLPTGTRVRAGSKILLSPYVVHRDPSWYPDPERFRPERFGEDARRGRPRYAYFPFGGGRRVCIGQRLAMLECTLVLARVAQRVRFALAGEPVSYVCGCLPGGFGPRMRVTSVADASPPPAVPSPEASMVPCRRSALGMAEVT
jgi:cytochrome P450